jgi:hypothetical protein
MRFRMRALPYAIGAFLSVPLVIWLVLALTILGGPQFQGEDPLSNALFAVTIPLVLWFMLSSLGSLANAMAGADQFAAPRWAPVRWTLRALPAASVVLGVAASIYLVVTGAALWAVPIPFVVAAGVGFAIHRGEAVRPDAAGVVEPARQLRDHVVPALAEAGQVARHILYATPLLGWIARDAARGGASSRRYLALNLAAVWLVAVWFGGLPVVIWTALLAAPLVFALLIFLIETR